MGATSASKEHEPSGVRGLSSGPVKTRHRSRDPDLFLPLCGPVPALVLAVAVLERHLALERVTVESSRVVLLELLTVALADNVEGDVAALDRPVLDLRLAVAALAGDGAGQLVAVLLQL